MVSDVQPRRRLLVACAVAGLLLLMSGADNSAIVLHSITIDGDVLEWGDVLTDPENGVSDAGAFGDPPDPDMPGTADRDLRGVAFTWDASNLYIFFRRTLSGSSSFDFLAYVDLDHDGRLRSDDVIVRLSYGGSAFSGGEILEYVPADAINGDAITGDGVDEPGSAGATLPGNPTSADSPDGIEFEIAVPWSDLGVPPGSCLWIHGAITQGINLPSQVEDNARAIDTQDTQPTIASDQQGSSPSPGQQDYAHVACNEGSCGDVLDLTMRSIHLWRMDIFSDPNGDGDPSDGTLLGIDGAGDADYSDAGEGDVLSPGADTNGNQLVDTGTLAAGQCFPFVVRVHVPAGIPAGTEDEHRIRARSGTRARELVRSFDFTNVGPITVFDDEVVTGVAGGEAWIPHVACNEQAFIDTINLSATSALGWTVEILSDPNGDGNPDDALPITSTGPLASGACSSLFVHVLIPPGEPQGTEDQVTLLGASQASASVTESSLDTIRVVADRFSVLPNFDRHTGPGATVFLAHSLVNHQGEPDSFALSVVPSDPTYVVTLLTDPDGDREPNDSATIPDGSIVGPVGQNGGEYRFIVRVDVPRSAIIGTSMSLTITARSQEDTSRTAAATDVIHISRLLTYTDPLFARPWDVFFSACATVYVQAHGLEVNRDYRFVWIDPLGVTQRTSPSYEVDARQRADDAFALPCGVDVGLWTIRLQIRSGSTWGNVPNAMADFTTLDPALAGGSITRLWMDRPAYGSTGETVGVETRLENTSVATAVNTILDHVIFLDADGDGRPTTGEQFILPDGSRSTWDPGEFTHRTEPVTVRAGDTFDNYWHVANVQFGIEDTWCVHARWYQSCDNGSCNSVPVDEALTCFLVSCLPAPLINAGSLKTTCADLAVALSDATSDGDAHLWSDGGVGGVFSPSATVLHPTWLPPGPGTFLLSLTSTFSATGCDSLDTAPVIVESVPAVEAGPPQAACAGAAFSLSGVSSDGDTHLWSDGGAGGTFAPSATVLNPTYTSPDPAPATITLTLTSTFTDTGCDTVDTLILTMGPRPLVEAGPGTDWTTCAGDGILLSGASSTGDTHLWTDGGVGGTFTPSADVVNATYAPPDPSPASITLTLTSSFAATGCEAMDTLDLTVEVNPVVDADGGAGGNVTACAGSDIELTDATSNGDAHAWSDGGAGGTFAPSADVLNPTYLVPDPAPATITLTLTSTITATGCDTTDSLLVTVNPKPIVEAGLGTDWTTCAGDGILLSGASSTGDTHLWTDGGVGGTFTPSADVVNATYAPPDPSPASITLTLTSTLTATGCTADDTLDLTVDVNPVIDAGGGAGGNLSVCAGDELVLADATSNADTHLWSDGGAGGTFTPSADVLNPSYSNPIAGIVTLTLTSSFTATGCDSVDTVDVTLLALPVVSAGPDQLASCASPATLEGSASGGDGSQGYTYRWEPAADVSDPDIAQPTTTIPGDYTLTVTDVATGCSASDSVTIGALPVPVPTEPSGLLVAWLDPLTRTELSLTWQDVSAFAYAVHAGSIAAFDPGGAGAYDHSASACGLPGASAVITAAPGSHYFIPVAVNCEGIESSYGRSSLGMERPDSMAASGSACP